MQPTQLAHLLDPRPQIKMLSIPQKNLHPEFLENVLGDTFDRRERPHRHEYRGLHHTVRRSQPPNASGAASGFDLKGNRHWWDCSNRGRRTNNSGGIESDACVGRTFLSDNSSTQRCLRTQKFWTRESHIRPCHHSLPWPVSRVTPPGTTS